MPSKMQFPFSAVQAHQNFKLALILSAIDPSIGGVLISGDKGSAKSTLARSVINILPTEQAKFVTLPLGCSTDMLVGSLDLQTILSNNEVKFLPGLISKAHEGILYVDEVNLLPDHLVDQLLDVAASKSNKVERDGISHEHAAEFVLIGTMNPDEGQLRSQLLDRFALNVELETISNAHDRVAIIKKNQSFSNDPKRFCDEYAKQESDLKNKIQSAKQILKNITLSDEYLLEIASICIDENVEGLRADIVLAKTAKAHAAWFNKKQVDHEDIAAVKEFVLSHRRKEQSNNQSDPTPPQSPPPESTPPSNSKKNNESSKDNQSKENLDGDNWGSMTKKSHDEIVHQSLTIPDTSNIQIKKKETSNPNNAMEHGKQTIDKISWIDSFKKNKSNQTTTLKDNLVFKQDDPKIEVLHMILMDTSASTLQAKTLGKSKGVIHAIANQAYLAREDICIHEFGTSVFEQTLNKIKSPKDIEPFLKSIKAGGGTPLVESITQLKIWQKKLLKQSNNLTIFTYLLSDGRTNENLESITPIENMVVIDLESKQVVKRSKCESIAKRLNAQYICL